jgi:hypothetical protein
MKESLIMMNLFFRWKMMMRTRLKAESSRLKGNGCKPCETENIES